MLLFLIICCMNKYEDKSGAVTHGEKTGSTWQVFGRFSPGQALGNQQLQCYDGILVNTDWRTRGDEWLKRLKWYKTSNLQVDLDSVLFVFTRPSVRSVHLKRVHLSQWIGLWALAFFCFFSIERRVHAQQPRGCFVKDERSDIKRRRHKASVTLGLISCTSSSWIWMFHVVWLCMQKNSMFTNTSGRVSCWDSHQ